MESAIDELVQAHAVVEVPFIPHVVNLLSVSIQSSGKKRLILDLHHVNHIFSFGNRSLGVKIGEFYYRKLIRAITFSVSISSLDITISMFFRITKLFLVSPGFFLVPFGIFVLHHFRSVLAQPHTSSPSVLDHSLSFGGLTGLKLLCSSTMGAEKGIHCLWPRKIHCLCNHP